MNVNPITLKQATSNGRRTDEQTEKDEQVS